jgi:hypothetical protein
MTNAEQHAFNVQSQRFSFTRLIGRLYELGKIDSHALHEINAKLDPTQTTRKQLADFLK